MNNVLILTEIIVLCYGIAALIDCVTEYFIKNHLESKKVNASPAEIRVIREKIETLENFNDGICFVAYVFALIAFIGITGIFGLYVYGLVVS